MALFPRDQDRDSGLTASAEAAVPSLSATSFESDYEAAVYGKMASVYDLIFGLPLQHGRLTAIRRMGIRPGDRILEVGVGTGIDTLAYPGDCFVTAIDLSACMLERARARLARHGVRNVRLLEMDAAALTFPDDTFDIVYAPHLISCVRDPIQVTREMRRVCKPGGRIIFLNHFRSTNPVVARFERAVSPLTVRLGFKADLDLPAFLAQARLHARSIEKVNIPRWVTLVTCAKHEARAASASGTMASHAASRSEGSRT